MYTTIAVKKDTMRQLKQLKKKMKAQSNDETIKILLREQKKEILKHRGALKHVKEEFVREEIDRFS